MMSPETPLSATGPVILGMLADGPKTGYEIKALSDRMTRFFWAASFGQIYPELKRLAERGLVRGEDAPTGERRRIVYRITSEGQEALCEWIAERGQVHELRDEGLLKLFFGGNLERHEMAAVIAAKRQAHASTVQHLRSLQPEAEAAGRYGPTEVLAYGLELHEFAVGWCNGAIGRLERRLR